MHIKRRGTRAMLYRSSWVAKGTNGNTHGYSTQHFVGSIPLEATKLPDDLVNKLTTAELDLIEIRILKPARQSVDAKVRLEALREADPMWRLDEALRLTQEAAVRSAIGAVPNVKVTAINTALASVKTICKSPPTTAVYPYSTSTVGVPSKTDPLVAARDAIKTARDAVQAGHYRSAPAEGVRNTHPYKLWSEIFDAIEGRKGVSLMQALQARGFVKTREVRR